MIHIEKKRYEFRVVIHEGSDEFWESVQKKTGCEEVTDIVRECLEGAGFREGEDMELVLMKYTND